jgi:chromosome segregation ATPase
VAPRKQLDPAGTAVVDSTVQQPDGINPLLESQRTELALLKEKLIVLTARLDELDLQLQHSRQQELHWQEQFRAAQLETRQLRSEVSLSQRAVQELRADFEQQQRTDLATFDQLLELVRGLGPIVELVERTPESR